MTSGTETYTRDSTGETVEIVTNTIRSPGLPNGLDRITVFQNASKALARAGLTGSSLSALLMVIGDAKMMNQVYVNVKTLQDDLSISYNTARKAIDDLVRLEVLIPVEGRLSLFDLNMSLCFRGRAKEFDQAMKNQNATYSNAHKEVVRNDKRFLSD